MMKTKWQHGIMLSLFVSGLLIGSGEIVGLADDGQRFKIHLTFKVVAVDDGQTVPTEYTFATEERWVKPHEALTGNKVLSQYMQPATKLAPENDRDPNVVWKYHFENKPAKVTITYVDQTQHSVGTTHTSSGGYTMGGRMQIVAPIGYQLVNPQDKERMAIQPQEMWRIRVEKTSVSEKPATGGNGASQSNEGVKPIPAPQPEKPTSPTATTPQKPTTSQPEKPIFPVLPTHPKPKPTFPITHPELVVPVAPDPIDMYPPVTVPKPQVIYTPEGPINSADLAHVSEMAEHPITAIDGSSATTVLTKPQKASKAHSAPMTGPKAHAHNSRPLATDAQRRLPQTNEQTTNKVLLGLATLTGLGIIPFRRFRH